MRRPARLRLWLLSTAATLVVAIPAGLGLGHIFEQADARHYLDLAAGRPAMLPFASRQLEPLLVRALPVSAEHGFLILGVLALLVFAGTVAFFILQGPARTQGWMLVATMPMFFWAHQFNGLVLPDLFYAALVCGLLLLLWRRAFFLAAAMLFPLAVARESTSLLLVCLLIACWRDFDWRHKTTAILATVAGFLVVRHLTANSLANQEHISPALYMVGKMPWNFFKNFLGISPWSNVNMDCGTPAWQVDLHLGPMRAVGSCGFKAWLPVRLAGYAMASFGLLPLLLWRCRGRWGSGNPMLRFALIYGLVSFLIAGALGDKVERLLEYGWPAFLVVVPWVLAEDALPGSRRYWFVGVHLLLSWAVVVFSGWPLLLVGMGSYGAGIALLGREETSVSRLRVG